MYSSFNARAVGLVDLPASLTIEVAAAAGFAAVDLMIRDLVRSGADLDEIHARMTDRGLRAGAFPMTMNWRGDAADFERDLAKLPVFAEAAARLGFARTGTWVLPETPTMPPTGADRATHRAEVAAWHEDRIGAIARVLAPFQIRLGLEVIGVTSFRPGVGVPFVTRIGDLAATLPGLFHEPTVGLLVDVWHLYAADEPLEAALAWGADRVVWAHVAGLPANHSGDRATLIDAERGLPETPGAIDCRGFLRILHDAGFDGPVTVEPLAQCESLLSRQAAGVARQVQHALAACWPA